MENTNTLVLHWLSRRKGMERPILTLTSHQYGGIQIPAMIPPCVVVVVSQTLLGCTTPKPQEM